MKILALCALFLVVPFVGRFILWLSWHKTWREGSLLRIRRLIGFFGTVEYQIYLDTREEIIILNEFGVPVRVIEYTLDRGVTKFYSAFIYIAVREDGVMEYRGTNPDGTEWRDWDARLVRHAALVVRNEFSAKHRALITTYKDIYKNTA